MPSRAGGYLLISGQKVCLGFYCTGVVTALVLLTLTTLLCVENQVTSVGKPQDVEIALRTEEPRRDPLQIHLPTTVIYKRGDDVNVVPTGVKNTASTAIANVEDFILGLPWVGELHEFLIRTKRERIPQVSMVVTDYRSVELLLNWLIVALVRLSPPLHNVMVIGLDEKVCKLLAGRNISCIHVDPDTFMKKSYINSGSSFTSLLPVYRAPQTRLLVARLVNFWGFSFASYDTDALVLRDPQPIFDGLRGADIVAGTGARWPRWAAREWGFAVCLGAVMMRSGVATEQLWYDVSQSWGECGSEQDQFNRALKRTITWNQTTPKMSKSKFCHRKFGWKGVSKNTKVPKLTVLLLPQSQICRGECCNERLSGGEGVYVSHGGGGIIGNVARKIGYMKSEGVWFLRPDWWNVYRVTMATGRQWLEQISTL